MSPRIADAGGSGSATWTRPTSCSWTRPVLRRTWCAAMAALPAASAWSTPRHTDMCGRPLRCKENLWTDAARDRMLPCVRPLTRHGYWPQARMGLGIRSTSLERARSAPHVPGSPDLASPTLRHTCPSTSSRHRQPHTREPLKRSRSELDKFRPWRAAPRRRGHFYSPAQR
jgi:hypothetical protein